ncbi:ribosome biogenesis factor YjgA [Thiohalocapsa sp. ML1]|jgi:ribosome-associated protein|uniref:ribosome biogenesis factor YjgA n=1 Tax=Thiohalocapsa sp. ML1 TaxID=1431688 RepID=UPI0007324108|nr:ribosome biogenesis factor YjgA [Thiohalocapsa sp. ML1]
MHDDDLDKDWPDGQDDGDRADDFDDVPAEPSKSARKRERFALQDLAEEMLGLPRAELMRLDLSPDTWVAIDETARIKDRRAMRRHIKRVANCLARENTEPLQALLGAREENARQAAARHHLVERWRARLIEEGDGALTEFLDAYPSADRQELRTLVRAAQRDAARDRPDAPRKLFRLLRELMDAA